MCNKYAASGATGVENGELEHPYKNLNGLLYSLAPGQTGCLQSGETFDEHVAEIEHHGGTESAPVTITSTDPSQPAIITNALRLYAGANYITIEHVDFRWYMPKPWATWNAAGNPEGTPNPEDAVQISIIAHHDSLIDDEINSEGSDICVNVQLNSESTAEHTLLEGDHFIDCGPPVTGEHKLPNEEPGWHQHAIYDYGIATKIRDNYILGSSRNGVVLYPWSYGAVVENNLFDENGAGITLSEASSNATIRHNIIVNSRSPKGWYDYGFAPELTSGTGSVFSHNCLYDNSGGEIDSYDHEPVSLPGVSISENLLGSNPDLTSSLTLEPSSPCLGDGPESAQPG